jgi:hypothetical protein
MNNTKLLLLPLSALAVGLVAFGVIARHSSGEQREVVRVVTAPQRTPAATPVPRASVPATPRPAAPVWPALWALDRVLHTAYEETKVHSHDEHAGEEHSGEGHAGEGLRLVLPDLDAAIKKVLAEPAPALQGGDKGWVTRRQQDLGARGAFLSDVASISDEELFLKFEDVVVIVEIMMSAADSTHTPVTGGRHTHGVPTTPDEIAAAAAHAAECPLE